MREFIYNSWNGVMDSERNPLRHIPDLHARHMIMQILAWIWCIVFSFYVGSFFVFGVSAIAHVMLLGAIAITVASFEQAKEGTNIFEWRGDGYHSHGRGRMYTIYRDKKGNAHKVELPDGDPGGEHE